MGAASDLYVKLWGANPINSANEARPQLDKKSADLDVNKNLPQMKPFLKLRQFLTRRFSSNRGGPKESSG